jgi:hypothetical protein
MAMRFRQLEGEIMRIRPRINYIYASLSYPLKYSGRKCAEFKKNICFTTLAPAKSCDFFRFRHRLRNVVGKPNGKQAHTIVQDSVSN